MNATQQLDQALVRLETQAESRLDKALRRREAHRPGNPNGRTGGLVLAGVGGLGLIGAAFLLTGAFKPPGKEPPPVELPPGVPPPVGKPELIAGGLLMLEAVVL